MRSSSVLRVRLVLTCLIVFTALQSGFARERGPRIEVACQSPPIPVRVTDKQVLVYELHVTNFDSMPLTLKQLDVFADTDQGQPLKTFSGDALSAMMIAVGSSSGAKDPQTIDPGRRAVVFLWIDLGFDTRPPRSLRHRMIFLSGAPGGGTGGGAESTLGDFPVPVSQDAVTVLSPPFNGGVWLAGDGPGNDSGHRALSRRSTATFMRRKGSRSIGSKLARAGILITTELLAMKTFGPTESRFSP